jgi:hypothetical protein
MLERSLPWNDGFGTHSGRCASIARPARSSARFSRLLPFWPHILRDKTRCGDLHLQILCQSMSTTTSCLESVSFFRYAELAWADDRGANPPPDTPWVLRLG